MNPDNMPDTTNQMTDIVAEHELHGLTAEMLDWWWVNMEKGYPLWEPNEHGTFEWEIPPGIKSHIGAIHVAEERMGGGPIMKVRVRWDDPIKSLIPVVYEHAVLAALLAPNNEVLSILLHQYEDTPSGVRLRSTLRPSALMPPGITESWLQHNDNEMTSFEQFLPDLYRLWQVVKDPLINRQCSCKVHRL